MLEMFVDHHRCSYRVFEGYRKMRQYGASPANAEYIAQALARQEGYGIYTHIRSEFSPRGGMTMVTLYDPDSNGKWYDKAWFGYGKMWYGFATCLLADSYCKKTGIMIALKDAIVKSGLPMAEWLPLAQVYGDGYVQEVLDALLCEK